METGKILIFSICEFGEMYAVTRMYKPDATQLVDICALNAFIGIFFCFRLLSRRLHLVSSRFHFVSNYGRCFPLFVCVWISFTPLTAQSYLHYFKWNVFGDGHRVRFCNTDGHRPINVHIVFDMHDLSVIKIRMEN